MTQGNDPDGARLKKEPPAGSGLHLPRMISVLLLFNNPFDLDRICRRLEKNQNLIVDIRVSDEDAIHLMHYVPFDVIVTEYLATQPDRAWFLKTIRGRSIDIPVIYYLYPSEASPVEEARPYAPVYCIIRSHDASAQEADDLYPAIIRAVTEHPLEPLSVSGDSRSF